VNQNEEVIQGLKAIEQLAMGLQTALKYSSPQIRTLLSRQGFTFQRRISIQRQTWVLVGQIRKQLQELGVKK
jgi:uncharacterized protein YqcC (DUF446 family)